MEPRLSDAGMRDRERSLSRFCFGSLPAISYFKRPFRGANGPLWKDDVSVPLVVVGIEKEIYEVIGDP